MHIIRRNETFYVDDGAELIPFKTLEAAQHYIEMVTLGLNLAIVESY